MLAAFINPAIDAVQHANSNLLNTVFKDEKLRGPLLAIVAAQISFAKDLTTAFDSLGKTLVSYDYVSAAENAFKPYKAAA